MARPKKNDRKPQNTTDVDITKLEEELEKDVAKASGLLDDDSEVFVEDNDSNADNSGESLSNENVVSHEGYEMPPSNNPINIDNSEEVPKIDVNYIPDDDGSPLEEEVKHRDYATNGGDIPKNETLGGDAPKIEPVIPEPIIVSPPISDVNIGGESDEPKSNHQAPKQPSEPKRPSINSNLEDLSPSQKRKAAEQSADALLLAYGNIAPIPFKKISSFNLGKLDNAHLKGEVDKDMVIAEDGTTVKSYCEGVNQQVEQTFEITQEMKDEIRPPLIEVLLENNFALTPTQRLLMAVGGQIVTMGLTSFQFMQQNKAAMNQFKAFHKENKESRANIIKETVTIKSEVREPQYEYRTEKPRQEVYENIIPEPEIKTEKTKKVEDYISTNNSGITVEEVPNED
jgi:hypothetical protein